MRLLFILIIIVGLHPFSNGQDTIPNNSKGVHCDSVILYPHKEPETANYESNLELARELLQPIFMKHLTERPITSKYYFFCTVDLKGNIIDIEIKKGIRLPEELENKLKKALMEKTTWIPGEVSQTPCCSKTYFAINICML